MHPTHLEPQASDVVLALLDELRDLRAEVRDLRKAVAQPRQRYLRRPEAAGYLGIAPLTFDRHVRPDIQEVRRKGVVLFDVEALDRWATLNSVAAASRRPR